MTEFAKGVIDHRASGFRCVAAPPERHAKPIAELGTFRPHIDPARADRRAIEHDDERHAAALAIYFRNEAFRVAFRIGMRNARGVLRNAAVAGQARECWYVLGGRGAQEKPFGFKRGYAARGRVARPDWRKRGDWDFSCERHRWAPARNRKGSRHAGLPFFEPILARRFDWMPADLI